MEKQKIPVVIIHSQSLSGYLMMCKFILIDKRQDLKNKDNNVFVFKDSPEIRNAMKNYSEHKEVIRKIINNWFKFNIQIIRIRSDINYEN